MTDLDKLIEAVEVGDPNIWLFHEALPREIYDRGFQSFNGSLDAAKALHDALLPEWEWTIFSHGGVMVRPSYGKEVYARSHVPAPHPPARGS